MLRVPNGWNGRPGHGAALFTATSANVLAEPDRRLSAKYARFRQGSGRVRHGERGHGRGNRAGGR